MKQATLRLHRLSLAVNTVLLTVLLIARFAGLFRTISPEQRLVNVERDLNEIYKTYRPFPYRWAGAPYSVPFGQHPAVPKSTLASNLGNLQRAEDALGRSSRSLRLRARIEMLAGSYDDALKTYQQAIMWNSDDSSFRLELAFGFALRARAESRALDLERALEIMFSIREDETLPELRFDKALLFEDVPLPSQAAAEWQRAISQELSSDWAAEGRTRLASLQLNLDARQKLNDVLTGSASSYLIHADQSNAAVEIALTTAVQNWLPDIYSSDPARQAVEKLAKILANQFGDAWLADISHLRESKRARSALRALSYSISSNLKGEHLRAQSSALFAEKLFHTLRSDAGELRSRIELVYSLDRRWKQDDCLLALGNLKTIAHVRHYVWIEAQAHLEEIACQSQTRKVEVISIRQQAYNFISKTGFEGLALRALSFLTEQYGGFDSRLHIWQLGHEGLSRFWANPMAANRGYTLYYTLATSARSANHKLAAVALLREGVETIKDFPYKQLYGLALSNLGAWESEVGLSTKNETFGKMETVFENIERAEAHFWRDAEITRSQAEIASGDHRQALAKLQEIIRGKQFPYFDFGPTERRRLLPALGDAYLAEGDLDHAFLCYNQIVSENERDTTSILNRSQVYEAQHEIESAWRGLAEIQIRRGAFSEALGSWQSFRSGRRSGLHSIAVRPPVGMVLLSYSFLRHGLSGWFADAHGINQKWLNDATLGHDLEQFALLVSDPESPLVKLHASAQRLYAALIQPFEQMLPEQAVLIIDADGPLGGIPWSALEDSSGRPLLERFAITQTKGWREAASHLSFETVDFSNSLIIGNPKLGPEWESQYPPLPSISRELQRMRALFQGAVFMENQNATAQALLQSLPLYNFLHFGGHGVSYGGFGALLLAPPPGQQKPGSLISAEDISQLPLKNLQLVVLAACSSGVGEASGAVNVDSLVRAFIEAGAFRVVAARWNVNSLETADMMMQFYDRILEGKRSSEALRLAALSIRHDGRTTHPYYWAGFQNFGSP